MEEKIVYLIYGRDPHEEVGGYHIYSEEKLIEYKNELFNGNETMLNWVLNAPLGEKMESTHPPIEFAGWISFIHKTTIKYFYLSQPVELT